MFDPQFRITPPIAKALMQIESCKSAIESLPLSVPMLESLQRTARLLATHFSTQIEGNKLTPAEVGAVLAGGGRFPGRERDEAEVRCYHEALQFVLEEGRQAGPITETAIRRIHGCVMTGKKRATPYRDGQNVIRNGRTGGMVYLPPEAADVPKLMQSLTAWLAIQMRQQELPTPLIAALAHYQFATIHPYFDGNGRTARLLTTLILHRGGYGLHGIYSLEEYYAQHLDGYYAALSIGKSHNYYMGRAEADITPFVRYFCEGMAESFQAVRRQAEAAGLRGDQDESLALRELTAQQRAVLSLFRHSKTAAAADIAAFFGITSRAASYLCSRWVADQFFVVTDPSRKRRRYALSPRWEPLGAGYGRREK